MNPWWLGLAPAQTTVHCAGRHHQIRWDAGQLSALDHEDPEGERTLAALGGQRRPCIDLLDVWERHQNDARVLVLATRGPADQLAASDDDRYPHLGLAHGLAQPQVLQGPTGLARRRRGRGFSSMGPQPAAIHAAGWTGSAATGRISKAAQAESELIALLTLGGGLHNRLVATVAAAWRERLRQPDGAAARVRPQLQAALHGRVFDTIQRWLGGPALETHLRMIGEAEKPTLVAEDGVLRAQLPFAWLVDVWAKGIATIWGRFCLAATRVDAQTWRLLAVGPDLGPPAPITLQLAEPGGPPPS
jgi:hypothetical protein